MTAPSLLPHLLRGRATARTYGSCSHLLGVRTDRPVVLALPYQAVATVEVKVVPAKEMVVRGASPVVSEVLLAGALDLGINPSEITVRTRASLPVGTDPSEEATALAALKALASVAEMSLSPQAASLVFASATGALVLGASAYTSLALLDAATGAPLATNPALNRFALLTFRPQQVLGRDGWVSGPLAGALIERATKAIEDNDLQALAGVGTDAARASHDAAPHPLAEYLLGLAEASPRGMPRILGVSLAVDTCNAALLFEADHATRQQVNGLVHTLGSIEGYHVGVSTTHGPRPI